MFYNLAFPTRGGAQEFSHDVSATFSFAFSVAFLAPLSPTCRIFNKLHSLSLSIRPNLRNFTIFLAAITVNYDKTREKLSNITNTAFHCKAGLHHLKYVHVFSLSQLKRFNLGLWIQNNCKFRAAGAIQSTFHRNDGFRIFQPYMQIKMAWTLFQKVSTEEPMQYIALWMIENHGRSSDSSSSSWQERSWGMVDFSDNFQHKKVLQQTCTAT